MKIMLLSSMICVIIREITKKEIEEKERKKIALKNITFKKEKEEKENMKYDLPKATEIILKYIKKKNDFSSRIYYLEKIKLLENEIIDKCLKDKSIFTTLCSKNSNKDLNDVLELCFLENKTLTNRLINISRLQKLFKMNIKLNLNDLDANLLQYYCTTDMDVNKVIKEIEGKSSVKIKLELLSVWKELVGEEKWKNILEKKINDIYNIFQAENFIHFIEKLRMYDNRINYILKFKEIIGHEIFEKEMMVNLPILYGTICRFPYCTFRDVFLYLYNNGELYYSYIDQSYYDYTDIDIPITKKIKSINRLRLILGDEIFKKETEKNIKNIYRFLGTDFDTDTFDKLHFDELNRHLKSKKWILLLELKKTFGDVIFKNDLPLMDLYKLILGEENFEKIKNKKNIHMEILKQVVINNKDDHYIIIRKLLEYKKLLGKYFFDILKTNNMEIIRLIFKKKSNKIITIKDIFQLMRYNYFYLENYWNGLLEIKELFGDYWNEFVKENLNEYYKYLCCIKKTL